MTLVPIHTQGLVQAEKLRILVDALTEAGARGVTRPGAAATLGVSIRQLDRALKALEEDGAEIQRVGSAQETGKRLVLAKPPAWHESLTHEALLALRLAAALAEHAGSTRWAEHLQALEAFADKHITERERRMFQRLRGLVHIQGGVDDPIEPEDGVRDQVMLALAGGPGPRELRLEYRAAGEAQSAQRRVVPYRLTHDIFSGGTFLLAWDLDRQAPRQFRLSRIVQAEALARPGHFPEPAVMEAAARYQIGGWIGDRAPFEIKLRVRGVHWVRAMEDAPPALPDFRITPLQDGLEAKVSFKARGLEAPTRWLLQFGDAVSIEGPEALREHVATVVAAMGRNLGAG